MVSIDSVTVHFGAFELLNDISFQITKQDRIGLVGKNGAGKSTLLKLIVGELSPTKGQIAKPTDLTIGYLPQHLPYDDTTSVLEETLRAFDSIKQLQNELDRISEEVAERDDYETEAYGKLLSRLTDLTEQLAFLQTSNPQGEAEKLLKGLGFLPDDFSKPTAQLSGGWRMRIELAKILLQRPQLLLLDEPTNHLDIEAIMWFESFLENYYGTVVLISHDKRFLDAVTKRTIEISLGKIYDYKANYSHYLELRKERRQQLLNAYKNQQKKIEKTEEFIERFRYKATKAVQVQSKIKQLDKMERIEIDPEDKASIHLKFPPSPRAGSVIVEMQDLTKKYGDKLVLDRIDLVVERNEQIAFVGKNGEGKSTLVKILMEETSYDGFLKKGHNLQIGYFAQNQAMTLDDELTVFQTLDNEAQGEIRKEVRNILGAFLFGGDDVDKKVKVLSGGERTRLALSLLLLKNYNVLILDEPTNHLDIPSKEVLKQALRDYDGTLIVVSHDRDFLEGLVDKVYEFKNHKVKQHIGGIDEFLRKKAIDHPDLLGYRKKEKSLQPKEKQISGNKQNYEQRKQQQRELRNLENKIKRIQDAIKDVEDRQMKANEKLQENLSSEEYEPVFKEISELTKKYDQLFAEWETLETTLETLKEEKN